MDKQLQVEASSLGEGTGSGKSRKDVSESRNRDGDKALMTSHFDSPVVSLSRDVCKEREGTERDSEVRIPNGPVLALGEEVFDMDSCDSRSARAGNNFDVGIDNGIALSCSSLGDRRSPREEYSLKSTVKSINKMRNELGQINNSVLANEKMYKSSLLSNRFIGNLFGSFRPFISGINRFTVRNKQANPFGVANHDMCKAVSEANNNGYLKYSTQWYLLAKRRNAELITENGGNMGGSANQTALNREISMIEKTVKFRMGLQLERSLFLYKKGDSPTT
ncbi:hypothetical protein FG386_002197 [Cryptosporidium ryanae]|uniref:uncharacterized protein n=1 Tax=Cryptosporidium ryanae TaxID=515981 RepID=UPI00351A93B5|nr:hypothetical protein FG386_002197 [Cryptosporidium ryanae]